MEVSNLEVYLIVTWITVIIFGFALVVIGSILLTKCKIILNIVYRKSEIRKTPLTATDIQVDRFEYGKCPICGNLVWKDDKRCKNCGQKIKWENEDESKNDS